MSEAKVLPLCSELQDKQFLFLLGAPRSGTTWLQLMLAEHVSVATTVEIRWFNWYIAKLLRTWKQEQQQIADIKQGLSSVLAEEKFLSIIRDATCTVYKTVLSTNPMATHILDKSTGYAQFIPEIESIIPHARYIHLIRDGRDVASSNINTFKIARYGENTVEKAILNWQANVTAARQNAPMLGDRYLEIRYENLHHQPYEQMLTVFEFCGLDTSNIDINHVVEAHQFDKLKQSKKLPQSDISAPVGHYRSGKIGSWQTELSSLDCYNIEKIAGSTLREYQYNAYLGWWAKSSLDKLVIPPQSWVQSAIRRIRSASQLIFS